MLLEAMLSASEHHIVLIVGSIVGSVSLACSILTLLLIYLLNKWNGYISLLVSFTCCQILYDLNYIMRINTTQISCPCTFFLDILGGLGVSFWTIILSYTVAYTVVTCSSIKIFKHYWIFFFFGSIIPFIAAILLVSVPDAYQFTVVNGVGRCRYGTTTFAKSMFDFYYWGRFITIFITLFLCILSFVKLKWMQQSGGLQTPFDSQDLPLLRPGNSTLQQSLLPKPSLKLVLNTIFKLNYYVLAQVSYDM
jgi:hypothetical protein